jgi:long-subunit fatty acid transport protein
MDVTIKYKNDEIVMDTASGQMIPSYSRDKSTTHFDLSYPAVYGLGFAYRFNDNLTAALDLSYTDWPRFRITEHTPTSFKTPPGPFGTGGKTLTTKGATRSAVNGLNEDGYCDARKVGSENCYPKGPYWHSKVDVDGVFTARLGAEYLFILEKTIIPARIGFIYDPEPALGRPDDFWGISVGTGVVLKKRFIFDLAYQHRWCNAAHLATVTNYDGSMLFREYIGEVRQDIVMLSSIVHFK